MKLNQLRDLTCIVESGSLRAAARRLGVAQPLLTRSVKSLEKELGTPLFDRQPTGMVLTPLGQRFYERARLVTNELRRAQEELQQAQGNATGTVTAGLSIMPHMGMLPRALPAFRRRYPAVRIRLIEGLFPDLQEGLWKGEIDFYVGVTPRQVPPGFIHERLSGNTRAVMARHDHPLIGARTLADLVQAEWALPAADFNNEQDLTHIFLERGLPAPRVALEACTALSMMVALASTDLLALLPVQWTAFSPLRGCLEQLRLEELLVAPDISLIRRSELPLTLAADYFCDLLRREI
ncbi:Galactose-binding protein regulator [Castellaniella defragrans 65Phen]|jgi:DNA-binding transcriptional LysR family regulator|uniref:Galactose-binding protein regulator n=1 Tax=Castellaniella defragrans (strain DSM 12143 / CCUG 39792 / 65Phen) TaxID=1437824 RepID=W8X2J7_CASD6|nr:LysR substrate-binding domain-containing protein [Castellaniella defragrans]CDM23206.1 Galactose-binding protein regulator [Castellaniella defragrans 65Phen]